MAGSLPLNDGSLTTWWTTDAVQLLQVGTPVDVKLLTRTTDPDAPTATISGETSAAPGKTITLTAVANDPNGTNNTLGYAWSHESTAMQHAWMDPTIDDFGKTAVYTVPAGADPTDIAKASVTVTDSEGKSTTAYKGLSVRSNASPTVSVTANPTTVNSGETVTLTGDASDPDVPTDLTYQWTSSNGTFADATALSTTWIAPTHTGNNNLDVTLTLTVTDDASNTATDTVTVTVLAPSDVLEVFISGGDRTVSGGGTLNLTSTVSGLAVPGGETYSWSGAGTFNPNNAADTTWTAPDATRDEQAFTLTLAVTEGAVTVTDTVTVTVPANQPPTVTFSDPSPSVEGGAQLRLNPTVHDPEGDELSYSWRAENDLGGMGSFSQTGIWNPVWTAPPALRHVQHPTLILTVTDAVGDVVRRVTAEVDVNAAPTVTIHADDEVYGSQEVTFFAQTNDRESDALTYAWTTVPTIGTFYDDDSVTARWEAPPAAEQAVGFELKVTVDDGFGPVEETTMVTIRANGPPDVTIGNQSGDVDGGAIVQLSADATDREGDTLSYEWSASPDRGTFGDPTVEDTPWTAPQATRNEQTITLTLTVTDDGAGMQSQTASVTMTVQANEAPTRPGSLPENLIVKGGETVSLEGTSDTDVTAYAWSTDVGTFAGGTDTVTATWTAPPPSRTRDNGEITLTVTDALSDTVFTIPVTVQADLAPTGSVNADPATVFGGKEVQLTDNTLDDGQSSLTRLWTASPDVGSFDNADNPDTTWTAPAATTADQRVTLTLTVTDAVGATDFTTTVTVSENQPPTVTLEGGETVSGGDMVNLAPVVEDPEADMLVYAWTAAPDSGTFQNSSARTTTWTAPAATRDAQVVVLTLTVTDDGAGNLPGSNTVTFTVRPLDTVTTNDPDDAPSFMSRHEGIGRDEDGERLDELQWLFPRRVPYAAYAAYTDYTDYAAIGFDGFEVQSRSRGPGEDWPAAWQLLDRVAADDIERAPASRARYAIAPAPDCWDREWRVRALYSPAEGTTGAYEDSNWLNAGDYNRPPDNPTPHTPLIDADNTWMTRRDGGYELQLSWGLGGRPSDQLCADDTDYTYEVQRRYIIGNYWGSGFGDTGEPRPANSYDLPDSSSEGDWWHGLTEEDWNDMWFNQPEDLWSTRYRGNRSNSGDTVNTAGVDCAAAPGHIGLLWDPDKMVLDGNDVYSEWETIPNPAPGETTETEDDLTCADPQIDTEYAVNVYYYQYRVRAVSGGKKSGWAEHRFTSHDLDREPPAAQEADDPGN